MTNQCCEKNCPDYGGMAKLHAEIKATDPSVEVRCPVDPPNQEKVDISGDGKYVKIGDKIYQHDDQDYKELTSSNPTSWQEKIIKKCRACALCWNHENKLCPSHRDWRGELDKLLESKWHYGDPIEWQLDQEGREEVKSFIQKLLDNQKEELRVKVAELAQLLTGHGKLPSRLEIEEQIKYHSRKSDHKHHEVAGTLIGYLNVLSIIQDKDEKR